MYKVKNILEIGPLLQRNLAIMWGVLSTHQFLLLLHKTILLMEKEVS
jgi:hypothetical protein